MQTTSKMKTTSKIKLTSKKDDYPKNKDDPKKKNDPQNEDKKLWLIIWYVIYISYDKWYDIWNYWRSEFSFWGGRRPAKKLTNFD